jgi:hypothetical protein
LSKIATTSSGRETKIFFIYLSPLTPVFLVLLLMH